MLWELDALPPEELARIAREAIEEHIDWERWNASTVVIKEKQSKAT
jgi:hypothetical protein